MAKQKEYLETFIEEQENQYMSWKHLSRGQPLPIMEGKGNKKLLGIGYLIAAFIFFVLAVFVAFFNCTTTINTTTFTNDGPITTTEFNFHYEVWEFWPPIIILIPFSILFIIVGLRQLAKHKNQKLIYASSHVGNKQRKKKKKR